LRYNKLNADSSGVIGRWRIILPSCLVLLRVIKLTYHPPYKSRE